MRLISVTLDDYPHLRRWFMAIAERPALQRGGKVIDDSVNTRPESAKVELDASQWSSLFGERQHTQR